MFTTLFEYQILLRVVTVTCLLHFLNIRYCYESLLSHVHYTFWISDIVTSGYYHMFTTLFKYQILLRVVAITCLLHFLNIRYCYESLLSHVYYTFWISDIVTSRYYHMFTTLFEYQILLRVVTITCLLHFLNIRYCYESLLSHVYYTFWISDIGTSRYYHMFTTLFKYQILLRVVAITCLLHFLNIRYCYESLLSHVHYTF